MEEVTIEKMVHGGQGLAELRDGRKVFVWNALPGELVEIRILKKKRSYAEAIAEKIITSSKERITPKEANYLATSPWQMMTYEAENTYKKEIVSELFVQAHIVLPSFHVTFDPERWHYRNKMEYSFWGDEEGLHLALHRRGSHGKEIVSGSELALPAVDIGANAILAQLQKLDIRASDLKTIIIRCSQRGEIVGSLFVKPNSFPKLELPDELKGIRVYYSNPKSPASVPTELLYELGAVTLEDVIEGTPLQYDVDSFFQVNIPIFEKALRQIKNFNYSSVLVDMYAGVGTIGLSIAKDMVELVELDPSSAAMARINVQQSEIDAKVIEASTEKALEYIVHEKSVILDPPRAGLHPKVINRILEVKPQSISYLSCNPATQARDMALLQEQYDIEYFEVFNFFPCTPHIESLAILRAK